MEWLKTMLADETGAASSTRSMMMLTGLIILMRFLAFNASALIAGKGGFDFSTTDVALLGVVLSGKVFQSFAEGKK